MTRMRILHVIESLEFGGAEKVVVELANSMAGRCDIGICCVKRTGELAQLLDPRIEVNCLEKGAGNHIGTPFEIAQRMRTGRFDVVHSHGWGVYLEAALGALLGRARVLVHTVHGNYLAYPPGMRSRAKVFLRHVLEHVFSYAHSCIVTVSDAIQRYVRADMHIPSSRLMTIHNGISDERLPRAGGAADGVRFISVGRLAEVKNYPMLLRAFARLLRENPRCRLQLVGDGLQRAALESLARELGIAGQVSFPGFQVEVGPLLARADVFVLSSRYEGISIALLEAMRAGLPAIATRVGGMAETILDGETGVLVPDDDEQAMAAAMLRLAAMPAERERMGGNAYAHLQRQFALPAVSEKYFHLYQTGRQAAGQGMPCS